MKMIKNYLQHVVIIKNINDFDYYLSVAFLLFNLRKQLNDKNIKYVLKNVPINSLIKEFKNNKEILLNEKNDENELNNNYFFKFKIYPYKYINIFNMLLNIIILSIKNQNDLIFFLNLLEFIIVIINI